MAICLTALPLVLPKVLGPWAETVMYIPVFNASMKADLSGPQLDLFIVAQ